MADREKYKHLVLVCCHATYVGDGSDMAEQHWLLQGFQRSDSNTGKPSEHETFVAHILSGAMTIESRRQALLVFSGGHTASSDCTEAQGYERVFRRLLPASEALKRYAVEDLATDSYQNLLFSVLRFKQIAGEYPRSITVITHAFKERRFLELHAPAIKWPASRIRVQGINPPFTQRELEDTQTSEQSRAYELFRRDPYGMRPPLSDKRAARGWEPRRIDDLSRHVESGVKSLLHWTGGENGHELFPDRLPWEDDWTIDQVSRTSV